MQVQQRSLQQWVDYIQTLHHREIELTLDRVASVYQRLYPQGLGCKIINIAGTNGKGSTAELLASIYHQAGYRVGKFTSPHLLEFAERYRINGQNADEQQLLAAFEKIEAVRKEVPITFFEFGTLLAIELFSNADVDIAIMEVGLGGRLDATNILDADVSIITSISIDHTAWLGETIEKIAREKVGIARSHKPCVVGISEPPQSIIDYCQSIDAPLHLIEREFNYQDKQHHWSWHCGDLSLEDLPLPYRQSGVQLNNASLAIYAIKQLSSALPVANEAIFKGIAHASILARCQILSDSPLVVLDVAHNQSSVSRLRRFVERQLNSNKVQVIAVCGMLKDKEIVESLSVLSSLVQKWHFADIQHERGATADHLRLQFEAQEKNKASTINCHNTIVDAYNAAMQTLNDDDVLIVFGSFFVASDILQAQR